MLLFNGTREVFLREAAQRLKQRAVCGRPSGLDILIYDDEHCKRFERYSQHFRSFYDVIGAPPKPRATCKISTVLLGDGHCRLEISFDGDQALVEERVKQLIDDLRADRWIPPEQPEHDRKQPEKTVEPIELSDREKELLQLVREELSRKEIAEKLVIATNTVDSYVQAVSTKLGFEKTKSIPKLRRQLNG
jgi:DNA-binding CsgD family transcriptional regulator